MDINRKYDDSKPLISLHIPKCAGQSMASSILGLSANEFHTIPYYPEVGLNLPDNWNCQKTIIHGHFVRWKGFAVEDICPNANQFTTVLREPFDIVVSAYFYGLFNNYDWALSNTLDTFMDWWINSGNTPLTGSLISTKGVNTVSDYTDKFILIGVVEYLDLYTEQLGDILNTRIDPPPKINTSKYTMDIPDRRSEFKKLMKFDYELYEYVLNKYQNY